MARKRKTVAISDLVERVNNCLANSIPEYRQGRRAVATLVESVLMDANRYRGFAYLPSELTESGELRPGYDDTRRRYFDTA